MNQKAKKTNRRMMLLIAAVFLLPVLLAKLALESDFFERKATNNGILLDPMLDFSILSPGIETEPKWRLVYALPEKCQARCENALYSIQQVWLALGKEMDRVTPLIVSTTSSDADKLASLKSEGNTPLLSTQRQNLDALFTNVSMENIFIVDTLNNIVLRYPLQDQQAEAVLHSREILADLRKLLKLSRIG